MTSVVVKISYSVLSCVSLYKYYVLKEDLSSLYFHNFI